MTIICNWTLPNFINTRNCKLQLRYSRFDFVRFNDSATFLCACFLLFSIQNVRDRNMTEDRQCTYHTILRRVREKIVQRKSNMYYIIRVCVFSLTYPACNEHAPYFHLWPARLCDIFPHYLTSGTILGEKFLIEHAFCLQI